MIHEDNKSKELYDSIIANTKDWYKKFIKPEIKENMKTAYYIQNKKEGKFIYKYLGIKHKPFKTGYVMKNNDSYQWSLQCPDDCDDTVSVKLLMSLDNQKLEKRISKLESKVEGLMNPVNKEVIPWPIAELTKPIAEVKEELTELPEKWCVKVTEENSEILTKWKKEVSKGFFDDIAGYYDYIQNDGSGVYYLYEGYTEITFSDFESLVLKKELLEKFDELKVGKWYKSPNNECLFLINDSNGINCIGYGFDKNGVYQQGMEILEDNYVFASDEEVYAALINESKRRYKKGDIINGLSMFDDNRSKGCKLDDEDFYVSPAVDLFPLTVHGRVNPNDYHKNNSNPCLFENGVWAEIVHDIHDEIDWSIPGQKVIGNQEVIVLTSGDFDLSKEIFSGIVIQKGKCAFTVGYFSKNWDSKQFAIYTNPVTL